MRQFHVKIRLNGSLYNEVRKIGVTVPEIIVLRAIHGGDSVVDINEIDPVRRTDADERDRLALSYGQAISKRGEIVGGLGALIGFGGALPDTAAGVPAPKSVKGKKADEPVEEQEDQPLAAVKAKGLVSGALDTASAALEA